MSDDSRSLTSIPSIRHHPHTSLDQLRKQRRAIEHRLAVLVERQRDRVVDHYEVEVGVDAQRAFGVGVVEPCADVIEFGVAQAIAGLGIGAVFAQVVRVFGGTCIAESPIILSR